MEATKGSCGKGCGEEGRRAVTERMSGLSFKLGQKWGKSNPTQPLHVLSNCLLTWEATQWQVSWGYRWPCCTMTECGLCSHPTSARSSIATPCWQRGPTDHIHNSLFTGKGLAHTPEAVSCRARTEAQFPVLFPPCIALISRERTVC